jgi:curved DNA-binding protein CbpA
MMDEKEAAKILGVSINCSRTELKEKFKKLAIKYHPDKGGDEYVFSMISTAFKLIHKRIKRNTVDERDFSQLKSESGGGGGSEQTCVADDSFLQQFNKHFSDNRFCDPVMDTGYTDFINEPDVNINDDNSKIVKYSEPIAQSSCKSLDFVELGKTSEDDYSGKNDNGSKLHFTDYKKAHTTSKLVDHENITERKQYKNIEDIKKDRTNTNFEQTPEEKYYYETVFNKKISDEYRRITNQKNTDDAIEQHHSKVKSFFIK